MLAGAIMLAAPAFSGAAGASPPDAPAPGAAPAPGPSPGPSPGAAALQTGLRFDVSQDEASAFAWYLRAARSGLAQAEFNVAVMLDSGRGVARDSRRASIWYAAAAAQGHGRAAFDLGLLYAQGDGVPRNPALSAAWYKSAASRGVAAATLRLAADRQPASLAGGELQAVEPMLPMPDGIVERQVSPKAPWSVQLVWGAPEQAQLVRYFVQVMDVSGAQPAQVFSGYTDVSAIDVRLDGVTRDYAWRVLVVSADAPHYRAGDWQKFSVALAGS